MPDTCFPQAPPLQCSRRAPSRARPPLFVASEFCRRPGFGRHHPLSIPRVSAVLALCEQLGWLDERRVPRQPRPPASPNSRGSTTPTTWRRCSAAMRPVEWSLRYASGTVSAASRIRCSRACSSGPRRRSAARSWRPSSRSRAGSCSIRPAARTTAGATARAASAFSTTRCSRSGACSTAGAARVLYLDLDAHHGDGVQDGLPRRAAGAHRLDPRARPLAAQRRRGRHGPRLRAQPAGAGRVQRQRAGLPDGRGGVAAGRDASTRRRWSSPAAPTRSPATRCRRMALSNVALWDAVERGIGALAAGRGARRRRLQSVDAGALLDRAVGAVEPPASPDGVAGAGAANLARPGLRPGRGRGRGPGVAHHARRCATARAGARGGEILWRRRGVRCMSWLESVAAIEEYEDVALDAALVAELERAAARQPARPIRFSTPTFKDYASTELKGCGKNSFPVVLDHRRRLRPQLRPLSRRDPEADAGRPPRRRCSTRRCAT